MINGSFATFQLIHHVVPMPGKEYLRIRERRLSPFRRFPPEKRFHPSIFPSDAWWFQMPPKLRSQTLQLRDEVRAFGVEIMVPIAHIRQTSPSNSFAVFERAEVSNVQFY